MTNSKAVVVWVWDQEASVKGKTANKKKNPMFSSVCTSFCFVFVFLFSKQMWNLLWFPFFSHTETLMGFDCIEWFRGVSV